MENVIVKLLITYAENHPDQIVALAEKGGEALAHALLDHLVQLHAAAKASQPAAQ